MKQRLVLPKNGIIRKNVLVMGLSTCVEWILNFVQEIAGVSTDPQGSWSTKQILFLSFLVFEAKTGHPLKWIIRKHVLAMELSACTEWILNFVQEMAGVSTEPPGSWSTKHILFLSFLVCEAKTVPPLKWNNKEKMFWSWDCLHELNGS